MPVTYPGCHLPADAGDYPDVIKGSVAEMYRQKGSPVIVSDNGQALTGLIIRHLVLPGCCMDSRNILTWIAENLSPSVHISLMSQYHPSAKAAGYPDLNRPLSPSEYLEVVAHLEELGYHNGWVQETGSHASYNPDFRQDHPFKRERS